MLYYSRLHTVHINPLLKESFDLCKMLDSEHTYSWITYIKDIISDTAFDVKKAKSCQTSKSVKSNASYIKTELSKYYDNITYNKISSLNDQNKIVLYKSLKKELGKEF